jgi:iron complex outermembrane receptor protein
MTRRWFLLAPCLAGLSGVPAHAWQSAASLAPVVVTAQGHEQDPQTVPIALDVIDAGRLDDSAAVDLADLDLLVPGLDIRAHQPTEPMFSLRGIGTLDYGIGTDPAVGVYIDGVYQTRAGGALLALNDVERVEILKGPQGALLGRNTAAGAVAIVTREPSDVLEAKARVRVGNQGQRYADALLNLPLSANQALRVSVLDNRSDGWIRDADTGRRYGKDGERGTRAAWRWDASPATRVLASWSHDRLDEPASVGIGLVPPDDSREAVAFPADPSQYRDPRHAMFHDDSGDGHSARRYDSFTLDVRHEFGWATLRALGAWTGYTLSHIEDADGTDLAATHLDTGVDGRGHSGYGELRLSGATPRLDWTLGASLWREDAAQTSLARSNTDTVDTLARNRGLPTGTPDGSVYGYFDALLRQSGLPWRLLGEPITERIDNHGRTRAVAVFADATWHLGERMNLTAGLRHTRDDKRFSWYTPPRFAPGLDHTLDQMEQAGVLALAAQLAHTTPQLLRAALSRNLLYADAVGQDVQRRNRWSDLSPRLALDWRFTPGATGYVSFGKGYKAGGYNAVQVNSVFAPEHVWNLEAGLKTFHPAQRLLLNVDAFAYRYDDRQALTLIPTMIGAGVPQYRVSNTDQQAHGLELETRWQPLGELQLGLRASWTDVTYRHARTATGLDLDGQPAGAPELAWAVDAGYHWHDVAQGDLALKAIHGYRGANRCNDDSRLQGNCAPGTTFAVGGARQRTDLRLDWSSANNQWGVGLYAVNLFNQRYVESIGNVTTAVLGTPWAYVTPPRSWGMELRASL